MNSLATQLEEPNYIQEAQLLGAPYNLVEGCPYHSYNGICEATEKECPYFVGESNSPERCLCQTQTNTPCPECGSNLTKNGKGDLFCLECGYDG